MKKLLLLLCILLLACPVYVLKEGAKGSQGKKGVTTIIEKTREKQVKTVFEGEITEGWHDIDLSFLDVNDFVEMSFIYESEMLCSETLKVYYQKNDNDIGTLIIQNKQSIVFNANNLTQFRWKSLNYGKKLRIDLIY